MATKVCFSDLTHTGQIVAANTFPLGITMIAAYAKKILNDDIEIEVFKYPEDLTSYLDNNTPEIVCFSIFAWNNHLSHEFARRIKENHPSTVTIFGGPNLPTYQAEQSNFLRKWPAVDIAVEGEGEIAFVEIFRTLKQFNFQFESIRHARLPLPNSTYLYDDHLIKGSLLPRIKNLEEIPSVFENNLSDKFFDKHLIPMIQTARGCPYSCTFCHEGSDYFTKTRRFSESRTKFELDYIVDHVQVPDFIIVDLNFGIFKQDLVTSHYISELQDKHNWPMFVTIATAKNNKQRVLEISKILRGSLPPGAAVQTTDPEILNIIKRKNLPMDAVVQVAKTAETDGAASFSEVILCLPGDSKQAHFQSIRDVIDAGFTLVRTYQFMLLAGTEAGGDDARKKYQYETRFRVKPMNFGKYRFQNEEFASLEIEEICVANSTMSYRDYKACRELSLTVELFNNNGIFFDFLQFLERRNIATSDFLFIVHDLVKENDLIYGFYRSFAKDEESNFWTSEEALRKFISQPGMIDRYIGGEFGTNEIYKYRAIAFLCHMEEIQKIAFDASCRLLMKKDCLDQDARTYLGELNSFSLLRKNRIFNLGDSSIMKFHFDFVKILDSNFSIDPLTCKEPKSISIEIYHNDRQRKIINGYLDQFGSTLIGLGRILNRAHIATMHRDARYAGKKGEKKISLD